MIRSRKGSSMPLIVGYRYGMDALQSTACSPLNSLFLPTPTSKLPRWNVYPLSRVDEGRIDVLHEGPAGSLPTDIGSSV